jgi:transcriptional regulator with XRE-family HTH domain
MTKTTISPRQLAAARALLGLSQEALAKEVGVDRCTLSRYEHDKTPNPHKLTMTAIRYILEQKGLAFAGNGVVDAKWLEAMKAQINEPA